jgi:hypothetical protein
MPTRRISSALLSAVLSAAALFGGAASPALAAKRSPGTSSSLTMTSEQLQFNPSPYTPKNCLTEDDFDTRNFSGSLSGSYTTTYQLCGLDLNGVTAGGIGIEADVYVVGSLSDMTIGSPDGSVHHAVFMGSSTSRGVTTSHYATCYVPPYYLSTDASSNPLSGGAWNLTLSGQITNATWVTNAQMTNVAFQQAYCPLSEQNLL